MENRGKPPLQRSRVAIVPVEKPAGPEVRLIVLPVGVHGRLFDYMVLVRMVGQCKTPRDGLLVHRIGIAGQSMQLACLPLTLGTNYMFDPGQFQEITQFRRVQHVLGPDPPGLAGPVVLQIHRLNAVARGLDRNRFVFKQQPQIAPRQMRGSHLHENRVGHPRLVTQSAHIPVPRIQEAGTPRFGCKRVVPAVIVPHPCRKRRGLYT